MIAEMFFSEREDPSVPASAMRLWSLRESFRVAEVMKILNRPFSALALRSLSNRKGWDIASIRVIFPFRTERYSSRWARSGEEPDLFSANDPCK